MIANAFYFEYFLEYFSIVRGRVQLSEDDGVVWPGVYYILETKETWSKDKLPIFLRYNNNSQNKEFTRSVDKAWKNLM